MNVRFRPFRPVRAFAAFDPALPEDGALIIAEVLRDQFNGLKALIDAIASLDSAVVDATYTLPPGSPAEVSVSVTGNTLHFSFSIPQGAQGEQGIQGPEGQQGPPGEVTYSELNSAMASVLAQTSNNSNGVSQLTMAADGSYQQWQMQALIDKLDELIGALRR